METTEQIKLIRKYIKQNVPTVSVKCGQGTAWGWVEISSKGLHFTDTELTGLRGIGINCGGNFAVISPEDRRIWAAKLAH